MKIERHYDEYRPLSITLESNDEEWALGQAMAHFISTTGDHESLAIIKEMRERMGAEVG